MMDSGQHLVANGTRVGEIFSAAGTAFQKVGELAMLLQNSRSQPPVKVRDKIVQSVGRFASEIQRVTSDIRYRTEDQVRSELKRKYEEVHRSAQASSPSKRRQPKVSSPILPSAEQRHDGALSEATRILSEANAEKMALSSGALPTNENMYEDGGIVEEEIITTETDDGAVSDSGPVRGIGVAGSGESSSGEDEHVDPGRPRKRHKKRKTKRNEFVIGALRAGDDSEDDHMNQQTLVADMVSDHQLDIGLEESVEVSQTEEEVVHDGLELQFAVSGEEVIQS